MSTQPTRITLPDAMAPVPGNPAQWPDGMTVAYESTGARYQWDRESQSWTFVGHEFQKAEP